MIAVFWVFGLRLNMTPSYPRGLWQMSDNPAVRGELVIVTPPIDNDVFLWGRDQGYIARGNGPGGCAPLLKRLVAIAGDYVEVESEGLRVNGAWVPNSARLAFDNKGHAIPCIATTGVVPPGWAWILSDYNDRSFDSRYFGPVRIEQIVSTARPLFIW